MTKRIRDNRVIAAIGILVAAGFLGYLLYDFSQPLPLTSSSVVPPSISAAATADSQPDTTRGAPASAASQQSAPLSSLVRQTKASGPRSEPPESDRRIVATTLQKIHDSLATAEFSNAKVVDERAYPNGGKSKFLEVAPMSKKISDEAYAELSRGLQALSENSPLAEKLKYTALEDITSFTVWPKPFRLLMVRTLRDDLLAEKIYIDDLFTDDPKSLARDAQGSLSFGLGTGPGDVMARGGDFAKEGVHKRYSHFVEEAPKEY